MPRRHPRRNKSRGDSEMPWEEQEAPKRYDIAGDSEDSRSVHGRCDCRRLDAEDESARFFFRSNGSALWGQKRWNTIRQADCACKQHDLAAAAVPQEQWVPQELEEQPAANVLEEQLEPQEPQEQPKPEEPEEQSVPQVD